jgi:hypothetical protein
MFEIHICVPDPHSLVALCQGVRLEELRSRKITNTSKKEAEGRIDSMKAGGLAPHNTSGKWIDEDGEWLVIYASYHHDQGGKYIRDGFQVCTLSLLK